jgi:hypothetical protein
MPNVLIVKKYLLFINIFFLPVIGAGAAIDFP